MAPRANWKGHLVIGDLACHVGLSTAASTSERVQFHLVNRDTGHRVKRRMVDSDTGREVKADEVVKGYEISDGETVVLEPYEIEAVLPQGDKTLQVEAFIACDEIDTRFFDKPYYLTPADRTAVEAFVLIRDGLDRAGVAALARSVLFRRARTLLVRPHGKGMIATTLNYDYEIRDAEDAFAGIGRTHIEGEMLDLAEHIITTKMGSFDPKTFDDRYDSALAELVKAKIDGRKVRRLPPPEQPKVTSLMDALRQSAGGGKRGKTAGRRPKTATGTGTGTKKKAG